jgi:signal transduction histidine kinase
MSKILVIEDQDAIRANLLELLDAQLYSVMGAENGRVGAQLAREFLPDVIICDIVMPELDGYGVLNEMRRDPATAAIPFIFLTARADRADLRQGMELGADDYVVKPFTQDEILAAVSSRLARHHQVTEHLEGKLEELRSNIAASLPHEFLTPLTVIMAAAEILVHHADTLAPGDVPEIGERIRSSAERLHRLFKNFLLYTRLEMADTDPAQAAALRGYGVSAARAVVEPAALRAAQHAGRVGDLHLELCDATAPIEPAHLTKVVEELVDNALRYSAPGTPVSVASGVDGARVFKLSVTDHGRGMTPEQIARVGAYMQFDREEYEQQGQGLGLTIAQRLAKLYGGELSIASTPGVRTVVRFDLPIQPLA